MAKMMAPQRQTTDFILLKAEKQKDVAYRELLANLYQHLLEKCLTAGAADMNRPNYCPVNSSTQVAGQFPSQAYLFFLHNPNFQPTCRLLKSAFSNQHFTTCSPQISMTSLHFESAFYHLILRLDFLFYLNALDNTPCY